MLKLLRQKGIQKKIYIGLACIVTLSFVISGVMIGGSDNKSSSALAKVGDRKINVQEFLDNYRATQRQATMMYGDKLNELRGKMDFKSETWDRILLLEYAKKHNIRAGDKEVVEWVTKQEGFQKDGKFDDTYYKMYVERGLRSSARQFEEEIRQMLTITKVQDSLKKGLELSEDALKEAYKSERGEKDLVYGLVTSESFEDGIPVTEEDIQKLYDMVKDSLTDPKTGAKLTLEESKDEVKKKFRESKTAGLAFKKLQDIKTKIKTPADFETVLKAEGLTVEKLEKYKKGTYPAGIWPSENLQKAAEPLKTDGVSDVFEVPKGAMIIKVLAERDADLSKFEEEKKAFRERLEGQKTREAMEKTLEEMRGKLTLNVDLMKDLFPAD